MTSKSVPHQLAVPNEGGIYQASRPVHPQASIDTVTGLQAALDGKAALSHTHLAADLPVALQRIYSGTNSPEGVVTAGIGSLYLRTNGGANTSVYIKESGAGNTGWIAK